MKILEVGQAFAKPGYMVTDTGDTAYNNGVTTNGGASITNRL
jgi:hypothetical protein